MPSEGCVQFEKRRTPIGGVAKYGDEVPSRLGVDTGEGSVTRTVRVGICPVESDADYNRSWENQVEGEDGN